MKTCGPGLVLGFVLVLLGCSKAEAPKSADYNGIQVDIPLLKQTFASSPDLLRLANDVEFGLRYGDYAKAMQALEDLTNNPSCTEPQKKLVTTTMEQVKKLAENAAPRAGN